VYRLAVVSFYDKDGIFDAYMAVFLRALAESVEKIVLVVAGKLNIEAKLVAESCSSNLIFVEKTGLFSAYRAGIAELGQDELAGCDELILCDNSFFGPIFPLSELFGRMTAQECDIWGITGRNISPFSKPISSDIHFYPDSHFIVFRQDVTKARNFSAFWRDGDVNWDSDELSRRIAECFCRAGFSLGCYLDPRSYGSERPAYIDIDELLRNRAPILQREVFYCKPALLERYAVDLPGAMDVLKATSNYDSDLIWSHVVRVASLRDLNTNAAMTSVLPDIAESRGKADRPLGKIAVSVHVYYVEMLDDLLSLCDNIPGRYDFVGTTDTLEKRNAILAIAAHHPKIDEIDIRIVEQNRGRDMASLFITCRDVFLSDRYELVCRLHTKRTPQVEMSRSNMFRRHLFDNLLHSEGYVSNVIRLFSENSRVGLAFPPVLHISFWTLGHSWYDNREPARRVAAALGIDVPFDEDTPVAPYGTMYWFRPAALKRMFAHSWRWEDYNAEPNHHDGGLAHVQERLISYAAQAEGYLSQHIMSPKQAAYNYVWLEYKLQKLLSLLPNEHFDYHVNLLAKLKRAGITQC
jgi:lipopolysaccharide biosynthesis protein